MKEGIKLDEEIKVYFMQFRVEDRVHGQVAIVCIFLFLFFGKFSPCERSVIIVLGLGSVCVGNVVHNSLADPDPRMSVFQIHDMWIRWIRIRILIRIRNTGFWDSPDPNPSVRGTDPDPPTIKQK
jgi:hypothetical protein